jgi:hypothetical protein
MVCVTHVDWSPDLYHGPEKYTTGRFPSKWCALRSSGSIGARRGIISCDVNGKVVQDQGNYE